jgi:hypothetical protein
MNKRTSSSNYPLYLNEQGNKGLGTVYSQTSGLEMDPLALMDASII